MVSLHENLMLISGSQTSFEGGDIKHNLDGLAFFIANLFSLVVFIMPKRLLAFSWLYHIDHNVRSARSSVTKWWVARLWGGASV